MRGFESHESRRLAALFAIAFLGVLFTALAIVASGESPVALDVNLLMALRVPERPDDPLGPRWLEEAARDVTALGSNTVLVVMLLCTCSYLALQQKFRLALFVALVVAGGVAMSFLLKAGFDRPRPDLVAHQAQVFTSSFPSSHAMASAVAFLTLGALLARTEASKRLRAFLLGMAVVLTLIVGTSRVYLGVHWPSDVVAGWAAGAAWTILACLLARSLQQNYSSVSAAD